MRLIDADKFKDNMKYVCDSGGWLEPVTTAVKEYVVKNIDAQPTVDAEPVRHAILINASPYGECSCCGELIDSRDRFRYCPYCGARLDEQEKANDSFDKCG